MAQLLVLLAVAPAAHAEFRGKNGRIAYAQGGAIYTVAPDGSGRERIRANAADPALSRDGRSVAFVRDDNIWVVNLNQDHAFQLTDTAPYTNGSPNWSPDGESVVYDGPPAGGPCCVDIWFFSGGNYPLTADGNVDISPAYSPNGTHVVWTRDFAIWTMRADGSGFNRVTPRRRTAYTPQYSPSGHRIIYGGDHADLFTVKPNGHERERLTSGSGNDGSAVYSPDGESILFERSYRRGVHGTPGIYMMDADGSNLQLFIRHGETPSWAPKR